MTYGQQLANRYNSTLWHNRRDIQWVADKNDMVHLVTPRKLEREWAPEPGEVEHIQAEVARYVKSGMTQKEFNAMVDSGQWT
jgi:hypothetical protein